MKSAVWSAVLLGCHNPEAPTKPIPAALELVSGPNASVTVGSFAGSLTVRVKDASGNPVTGAMVNFTVSLGGGRVSPTFDTSKADGSASTAFTVGTVPGANQLTATVSGVAPIKSASVAGVVGPNYRIALSIRSLRYPVGRSADSIAAISRDSLGNNTGTTVAWMSRNPGMVSVTPGVGNSARVEVVTRPGQTYVVATAGLVSDSIQVSVLDASSTPCTYAASPTTLSIGGSVSFEGTDVVCIRSEDAGAEYALISHYGTPTATGVVTTELTGTGLVVPAPLVATISVAEQPVAQMTTGGAASFETALRQRERRGIESFVAGARTWFGARPRSLTAAAREGDVTSTNVNAFDFCASPDFRATRIAAITSSAVILSDTSNPSGGFTDAEYRAFGIAMDTLVSPVDTTAFGAPTDIDGNGRVTILFTRAVNALTPRGSTSGIVLGFFYSRDLLPRESSSGRCPGSNMSEMFYVMVPDTGGQVSDKRSKSYVQNLVVGTIAHEYQHLISASRRLYVNRTANVNEEVWLNEGLSHIAEELVFYRASKLAPRQNLGGSELQPGTAERAAFDTFLRGNFGRYSLYLRSPELNSPIASDDQLATRGATWALLRYLADRSGTTDGNLWYRIVNSPVIGVPNLDGVLANAGLTTVGLLRDWSVSVLTDDNVLGGNVVFQQPSWNFVTGLPAAGFTFSLAQNTLVNGINSPISLRAAGTSYARFAVPQNQEALVQASGANGRPVPLGMRLTVVRTK